MDFESNPQRDSIFTKLNNVENFTSLTVEQKHPPERESAWIVQPPQSFVLTSAESETHSTYTIKQRAVQRHCHPPEKTPHCVNCVGKKRFFDFTCEKCRQNVYDKDTSIAQLFSICRQWEPTIQSNMDLLVREILKRGAHPDDSDAITGMSLIHYVCKSGVDGMGHQEKALQTLIHLVEDLHCDTDRVCTLNEMSPLHYAVFYDVPKMVGYLISIMSSSAINQVCGYRLRTPLHLTASNLCVRSARILLGANANLLLKDQLDLTPLDCVPEDDCIVARFGVDQKTLLENALELRSLLEEATINLSEEQDFNHETIQTVQVRLSALGLDIGSRVLVAGQKPGTLRFCGPTKFSSGIWAGIELDDPFGKNDGSVGGQRYFTCPPNHGSFALLDKVVRLDEDCFMHEYDRGRYDTRKSVPRMLSSSSNSSTVNSENITIGNRVYLRDKKVGIVRFIGPTEFADGIWYGVELTRPDGKNDGSVNGVQYFNCRDKHGLFVSFSKIVRVMPDTKNRNSNVTSVTTFESDGTTSDLSIALSTTSSMDILTDFPMMRRQANSLSYIHLNQTSTRLSGSSSTFQRTASLRRSVSNMHKTSPISRKSLAYEKECRLRVGQTAFVNGQFGCVRYIGQVDFSDGVYLGIELKQPNGKNDGSIRGKRYFSCKPDYGLFVRPQKVTIHGISAAQMLAEDQKLK